MCLWNEPRVLWIILSTIPIYLFCLLQRWQSIVMSMSECVCVCVCLFVRQDISRMIRVIFTKLFVHVAHVRGSVLLRHFDDRPHCLSAGRGDGSAHRGQSVIYECLVDICRQSRLPLLGPAMPLKRKSRGWPRYGRLRSPRRRMYLYGQVRWSWTWWRRRRWRSDLRFRSRNSHCSSDRYRNRRSAFICHRLASRRENVNTYTWK